jgi:dienelactone hydrolase
MLLASCAASGPSGRADGPATSPAASPAAIGTVIPLATTLPARITHDDAMRLFEYDHSLPFDYREERVTMDGATTLHYFNYLDMSGKRKLATLVLPGGTGPFGAVIDLPGGLSGREEFEPDAIELAKHGIASLLIDSPELYAMPMNDREAVQEMVFEMRELKRLVDWLAAKPEVDPNRLGLAGVSYGAVRAGTFAGVEGGRLEIAVLMSIPPTYSYPAMAPFDPIAWVPYVSPCALYIQEGTQDTWFDHADGESLIAAAWEPKKLVWYDAGHGLNNQAYNDYMGWLIAALGKA